MDKATFDQITTVLTDKNYEFFTKGIYNLNLIGVRSSDSQPDKFDDHFHVIYRGEDNRFKHHTFPCTTDPGKHWLLNPMNIGGCAIMVPGQYKNAYVIGKHKGEYPALIQSSPIMFVRDNNRDSKLDFDLYRKPELRKDNVIPQVIGANIHRASAWQVALSVSKYSAACQVLQNPKDFDLLMTLVQGNVAAGHGTRFTYTLLEESDFEVPLRPVA